MRISPLLCLTALLSACAMQGTPPHEPGTYHLVDKIALPGDGGWDYVAVDDAARRVYIAHTTQVDVLDADSGEPVGVIAGLAGAHGTAIASGTGRGFITNGKADKVTLFDLRTLKARGEVGTGKKPDAIVYDAASHRVLAFNGEGDSATVIDATSGKKTGTIALGGGPEFPAPDGKGHVFVNLEDKSELLMLDPLRLKVLKRFPVAPGESPSSLAIDRKNGRLFIGCRNRLLVVMDAATGKVVATLPLGEHVDATAFDPQTKQVISSNGDGTLTVIHQDDADHYRITQIVETPRGSKTFGLDLKTHKLFVPAAEFTPAPAPSRKNPEPRPAVVPGTFSLLVYEE